MQEEDGRTATLIIPCKGYRNVQLIEPVDFKWLVRITGTGRELIVCEDEFELE